MWPVEQGETSSTYEFKQNLYFRLLGESSIALIDNLSFTDMFRLELSTTVLYISLNYIEVLQP